MTLSGRAAVITIDRPKVKNAVDAPTAELVRALLNRAVMTQGVVCIILTGANGCFCSGGDISAYRKIQTLEELRETLGAGRLLADDIESCSLPVIAAIDGLALGGGGELALACDLRFGSRDTVLGFPPARLGVIPGWNGTERLVYVVGPAVALRLLLSGERIDAELASEIGLIERLHPGSSALEQALVFADQLALAAPLAARGVKRVVRSVFSSSRAEARALAQQVLEDLWFSADHREAEAAFAQKRKPDFRGC